MRFLSFRRIINEGFTDFRRNIWLSAAATSVMAVTLFVVSTLFIARSFTEIALASVQDKVDISVYFELSASEQTISQIQRQVELLPEIKSIEYVSAGEAIKRFHEAHKDEPLLLESVDQFDESENPFPASFAIKVKKLEDYPVIISLFQEEKFDPFVSRITDKQVVVDRLRSLTSAVSGAGLLATAVLSFITILVMFNTVRLAIYNRRGEIEIMKLVGASSGYIRGPFVVEAVLYAFAGTAIASAVILPLFFLLAPGIGAFLGVENASRVLFGYNLLWVSAGQLAFGIVLGIVSTAIALKRYLKF